MWVVRRVLLALSLSPVAAGFLGAPFYVDPLGSPVAPAQTVVTADAVIALGGVEATAATAARLAGSGVAPVLVIADPYQDDRPMIDRLCRSRPSGVEVSCFDPQPRTTRGEAREIRRLATERGWDRVVVVAPTYHITRARWIVERCFDGDVVMADTGESFDPVTWSYQYAYQSAAFIKATAFQRGC